ncbi:MAG: fluoride efflux transporter CrcB [Methylophilaceae bacterium]|nr:fluoride efflux transporter CrcB [Methylophilaceae bacterium]
MGWGGFAAVGIGAATGAWVRWWLGIALNHVFPTLPLGTLAANVVGGYLMGIAMGILTHYANLPAEARLLITTGFLGGLTTFSTFSAEAVTLLIRHQYGWAAAHMSMHLFGSLAATMLGILTINLVEG